MVVAGLVLGRLVPGLNDALNAVKIGQTSLPIALGLLLMTYLVLALRRTKVRYREIGRITADRRMMSTSLTVALASGPSFRSADDAQQPARGGAATPEDDVGPL